MIVRCKDRLLLLTFETSAEMDALAAWAESREGHVFFLHRQDERTLRLTDLGPRADACREPINVSSRSPDPAIRLISNLAHTPFHLDGRRYASVEGFWQGLKFPDSARRAAVAELHGQEARRAGFGAPEAQTFEYEGREIRFGTCEHWQLMAAACRAKFNQCEAARLALLGTGERPLQHRTRVDSRTIPGAIMAEIWMKIRRELFRSRSPRTQGSRQTLSETSSP